MPPRKAGKAGKINGGEYPVVAPEKPLTEAELYKLVNGNLEKGKQENVTLRPPNAPVQHAALNPVKPKIESKYYPKMMPFEKSVFDYFQFDPKQFDDRVQLEIYIKQNQEVPRSFNTDEFKYYYVPRTRSISSRPTPTSLKTKLKQIPYITSNPTITFFLMDTDQQNTFKDNEDSEFYKAPIPSTEEIKRAIWNDLIHITVVRSLPDELVKPGNTKRGGSRKCTK